MALSFKVCYDYKKERAYFMCEIEMLKNHVEKKSDVESLMGLDIDLTDKVIEQLMENLGMCLDFPIVRVFSTIHKTGKSFYDYKMYVRLLKFYLGCKDISKEKRDKFYKKNVFNKEEKIGYRIIQLLESQDVDEKALLIGKLYVYCVEKEYDIKSFFRIGQIVQKCYFDDLEYLFYWESKETICAKNKNIPQEIMESLYSNGLLSERGYDGGGFSEDDDEGVEYALSKYGQIILSVINEDLF